MYLRLLPLACLIPLVCLIYGMTPMALAATVELAATGAEGFQTVVVSSSRVDCAACARKRSKCLALNRTRTALLLNEEQDKAKRFEYRTDTPNRAGNRVGLTLAFHRTNGGVGGLPNGTAPSTLPFGSGPTGSGPTGSGPTGGGLTGGSEGGGGGTNGGTNGGSQPSPAVVPLPATGFLLALGSTLMLLLLHRRRMDP